MKSRHLFMVLPLTLALNQAWAQQANPEQTELDLIVVTGTKQEKANTIQFKTRNAIQPLPAGDGAELLKSVPNMSITRKGGNGSEPVFRGLGASRLNIQADDQFIYGGCGGRMDPPTAYIFPTAYDEVIITKGPQSVTQGSGLVAGSVHFVRKKHDFSTKPYEFNLSTTVGNHGRIDGTAEALVGSDLAFVRANISHNQADNYKDGSGTEVHSHSKRSSQMLQVGVTPTANTDIIASYERSRGEAAYSDRMMDGSKFDRDAWNIRATQRNITDWWTEAELRYGESTIDHIMDNFTFRPVKAEKDKRLNNPMRKTNTAQLNSTFNWGNVELKTGVDYMDDVHTSRGGVDYHTKAYKPNQSFKQWGVFTEGAWQRTDNQRLIAGIRQDKVKAIYETYPQKDPNRTQYYRLTSGFARVEHTHNGVKYYAGIGRAERAPDYWERNRDEELRPERNTQIDTGLIWQNDKWHTSLSLFAGKVKDFILVEKYAARNIDATRYGGELEARYRFMPNWEVGGNLAYTWAKNNTHNRPLAQTPPLEANFTLNWDNGKFSAGALWRLVAAQHRYATGQGNIIGQDIGKSSGFGVLSVNAGWRINKHATLQAGVDNVFNKTYTEFISKGGNQSVGLPQNKRINEPGRQYWLRLQAQF